MGFHQSRRTSVARIEVRGRIWTSGPGASCAPCPTCLSTAAPPPQTRAGTVRRVPYTPRRLFDETGRALREEKKSYCGDRQSLHWQVSQASSGMYMLGMSRASRWAAPAMHAVTFLFGDSARLAWSSAAAARPAVVARVSRGLRSSVMAHLDRNCKRSPELQLSCLAVAAFDSAAVERRYRQKRC